MKIKEVEQRVGITSKNIRFYEKEGLITPKRNEENNYRDYCEEDILLLERIKILRVLGISIPDIKKLNEGRLDLESAMLLHVTELKQQEQELKGIIRICEQIAGSDMSLEQLDESIFKGEPEALASRLRIIFREDTTKEILTRKQTNFTVAAMLAYGYILNAIVAFIFGNYLLDFEGKGMQHNFGELFVRASVMTNGSGGEFSYVALSKSILLIVICVAAYIGIHVTGSMRMHLFLYHITAVTLTPVFAVIFDTFLFPMNAYFHNHMDANAAIGEKAVNLGWNMVVENENGKKAVNMIFTNRMYAAFWLILAVFVILMYGLFLVNEKLAMNVKFMMLTAVIFSLVFTGISSVMTGVAALPALFLFGFTLYLAVSWTYLNRESEGKSRFYAIQAGGRIMNFIGVVFSMRGKTNGPLVYR